MKMLNVACGNRYHKDWINIDINPHSEFVKRINVLEGLPFPDNSMDVVYSSHFLEHLTKEQAKFVLKEFYRVLKPNGILRIVVPDLENICREYLRVLELVINNEEEYKEIYEFITVELLDQLVRTKVGGEMLEIFLKVSESRNEKLAKYILKRVGIDLLNPEKNELLSGSKKSQKKLRTQRSKIKFFIFILAFIRLLIPKNLRELVLDSTGIGEKHRWMYDRYSLTKLLNELNFREIKIMTYNKSDIPNFNSYLLDINEDGTPSKGESSLYVEAKK